MDYDPAYRDIRHHVAPAVDRYRAHTRTIKGFLASHGLKVLGWETWDVAPFHVLNARKGQAVPNEILHALDAAIAGREAVSDQFTEANINPRVLMDASDVTHRVFIEKLRTMRRVWFPGVPEKTMPTSKAGALNSLTARLSLVQTPNEAAKLTKIGIFSALAGASSGPDFYKVSFDKPVELTIVSGALKRSFEVSAGHVKLTPCLDHETSHIQNKPKLVIPSLKRTAADVAAYVSARLRGDKRNVRGRRVRLINDARPQIENPIIKTKKTRLIKKRDAKFINNPATQMDAVIQSQVITRSMTKRSRAEVPEQEYIQISDDEDDNMEDESSNDKTVSAEPTAKNRENPFGKNNRDSVDCESRTLRAAHQPTKQVDAGTSAKEGLPAFMGSRTKWIVDVSPLGDITFFDPNGASPCTYLEEEDARDKLRDLLAKRLPLGSDGEAWGSVIQTVREGH